MFTMFVHFVSLFLCKYILIKNNCTYIILFILHNMQDYFHLHAYAHSHVTS